MEAARRDDIEIDLGQVVKSLWKKAWIVVLSMVVMALAMGIYTEVRITPIYQSTSKLYIISRSTSVTSLADLQIGSQLTSDYMITIKSRPVMEKVIQNLNLNMTSGALASKISISNPTDSHILNVVVSDADPYLAKTICDEVVKVSSARIAEIMFIQEPSIAEEANLPVAPSSPNLKRNILMGALIGAVLSVMVLTMLFVFRETISTEEDVNKYLGLTVLGAIPKSNVENKKQGIFGRKKE